MRFFKILCGCAINTPYERTSCSKYQSHDTDTLTKMEFLSVEHIDEYYKAIDDKIQSLMRRYSRENISRNSVDDHNVFPGT